MYKEFAIEYEVFEEDEITVLTVVDREKDEAVNMFNGKAAENIYRILSGEEMDKLESSRNDENKDKKVMEELKEEIIFKLNFVVENECLTKECKKSCFLR